MTKTKLDTLILNLSFRIEAGQEEMKKFADKFAKNPAYALEWANGTFQEAARIEVTAKVKAHAEGGRDNLGNEMTNGVVITEEYVIREVIEGCRQEVMRRSRYVPQSTSPTSNLMEQYTLAAWAETLEQLEGRF